MKPLTEHLFKVYKRLDGMKVMGFVATSALGNSQVQKIPFRLFCVRAPILVTTGDVMNMEYEEKAILLDHPSDNEWGRNFKLAFAKHNYPWFRPGVVVETVTGFKKSDGPDVDMGTLYVNFDTPLDDLTLGMNETEYRFLTGSDVQIRDKIGAKIVTKVTQVLGVNLVYAS